MSEYDRTVLAIASQNGMVCVTNERPMRKACVEYNLQYAGTLGVLGCARQAGIISIDRLADLLDKLEQASCYLRKDTLVEFRDEFELLNRVV